jgi:hypothetical protein
MANEETASKLPDITVQIWQMKRHWQTLKYHSSNMANEEALANFQTPQFKYGK